MSYITEMHIESAPSDINPHLYVSMQNGKLQLSTENAIYSYAENYHNFSGTFAKLHLTQIEDQDILILGFGLGSIPLILENTYSVRAHYTGVELDENVIYLFERYAAADISSNLQLICANALIYAATCQQKYKLICSDIFLDNVIPNDFTSVEYLQNLKDLIEVNGLLVFNTLALTEANKLEADTYFEEIFKKIFPNALKLAVHNNYMLLSDKAWLA